MSRLFSYEINVLLASNSTTEFWDSSYVDLQPLGGSVARSLGRSLARSLARSVARSRDHSLARPRLSLDRCILVKVSSLPHNQLILIEETI